MSDGLTAALVVAVTLVFIAWNARDHLARADADRLPVYTEATTRRAAAFYARHGFETTATIDLPGYPEIVTMWRPAR